MFKTAYLSNSVESVCYFVGNGKRILEWRDDTPIDDLWVTPIEILGGEEE